MPIGIYKRKPFSREHKKKMSLAHMGNKYALGVKRSEKTKKKMSRAKTREKHPNWKGGIAPIEQKIRYGLKYRIWKLEVYKRDKGICRLCGKKCNDKNIVAHHLKLFSKFPELRFSVDNGIVLCRSCHIKIHRGKAIEEL